jgi:hypothetical protein
MVSSRWAALDEASFWRWLCEKTPEPYSFDNAMLTAITIITIGGLYVARLRYGFTVLGKAERIGLRSSIFNEIEYFRIRTRPS